MDGAAYIPMDRRQAMAAGRDLPEYTHGAALFADVSGFTPLTAALLHAFGPQRGAEEMLIHLNAVYEALIAEVHRLRGSVIGFSGDAITCWFDGDDGARAADCGFGLQRAMREFAAIPVPSGEAVALAIKVAVAVGPARRFVVGDPRVQFIDVLAGATLDRMAAAEHLAEKGDVVLDGAAAEHLGEGVHVAVWRADETGHRCAVLASVTTPVETAPWPDLPPDALADEQARSWVLPPVYERLQSGQGDFLAELRPTVALFLRFTGLDYDHDPTVGQRLDRYARAVQAVVTRHGGNLLQVTVGDKGSYLYINFGAPLAHDDDAARAVAAALDLRALPLDASPDSPDTAGPPASGSVQIGISKGRMRVGACGSTTCRSYAAMGNETNMAARLMARAAPGQILISERVASVLDGRFDLHLLGPVQVKGRTEPIVILEVVGRPAAATPPPRADAGALVGREAELQRMGAVLERAWAGQGQILRVEGPAGIGKSHLAAALTDLARRRGVRVALGASQSGAQDRAYEPWRQILSDLLGVDGDAAGAGADADAEERRIALLTEVVAARNPDWLLRVPLLGNLLDLPIPDNPTTAAFEPRLRRTALMDLVAEIVRALAAEQPLLLMLEDVHWSDEASAALTVAVGRAIATSPLVLAFVHRPPLDDPILPALETLPGHERLNLGELGAEGVAQLMARRLEGAPSPVAAGLVAAVTQGNPFFVEELVDNLRESGGLLPRGNGDWWLSDRLFAALRQAGCLVHRDGVWTLAPGASLTAAHLDLPDSVHGMVLARMDRLPEIYKLTLKVASVIGAAFDLGVLARAHPLHLEEDALAAHLGALEARDFARVEVPPHVRYVFKHNVTREVAYETLLYTQRRQLHGAVGAALEDLTPEAAPHLAHHFFVAEDWPRAVTYQMEAGRQSQRLFANFDAVEHFSRALQGADHLAPESTASERQEIHGALGALLTATSQFEPALEHLRQALDLAATRGDRDGQARACRWTARLYELRGDYAPALEWIDRVLEALAGQATANAAEALITAGLINTRQGQYARALECCRQGLEVAQRLGETVVTARAYGLLGIITQRQGHGTEAVTYQQQALDLYRQAGDVQGQALVHNELANACFALGQWVEAIAHYRQARETFRQIGDLYNIIFADNNLGNIARTQGRLAEALTYFGEGLSSLDRVGGSPYVVGCFHMNLGGTYLRRGDLEAARHHLLTSRECYARGQARDFLPELHRLFAELAHAEGDQQAAAAEAEESLRLARDLAMRGEEGSTLRVRGQVTAAMGDTMAAQELFGESLEVLREAGDEYEEARTHVARARLWLAGGERTQAAADLDRAEEVFAHLDAATDLEAVAALRTILASVR